MFQAYKSKIRTGGNTSNVNQLLTECNTSLCNMGVDSTEVTKKETPLLSSSSVHVYSDIANRFYEKQWEREIYLQIMETNLKLNKFWSSLQKGVDLSRAIQDCGSLYLEIYNTVQIFNHTYLILSFLESRVPSCSNRLKFKSIFRLVRNSIHCYIYASEGFYLRIERLLCTLTGKIVEQQTISFLHEHKKLFLKSAYFTSHTKNVYKQLEKEKDVVTILKNITDSLEKSIMSISIASKLDEIHNADYLLTAPYSRISQAKNTHSKLVLLQLLLKCSAVIITYFFRSILSSGLSLDAFGLVSSICKLMFFILTVLYYY
jgi:hypothetical protein